jgi:hypothetical protein
MQLDPKRYLKGEGQIFGRCKLLGKSDERPSKSEGVAICVPGHIFSHMEFFDRFLRFNVLHERLALEER